MKIINTNAVLKARKILESLNYEPVFDDGRLSTWQKDPVYSMLDRQKPIALIRARTMGGLIVKNIDLTKDFGTFEHLASTLA